MFWKKTGILFLLVAMLSSMAWEPAVSEKLDKYFFYALNQEALPAEYGENLRKNDKKAALAAAAKYFRNRPSPAFFKQTNVKNFNMTAATRATAGEVSSIKIPYKFPEGKIDFLFTPTGKGTPYNPEWQWQLNRTFFWRDMALAYHATGDEKFAVAFSEQIRHWIIDYPMPDKWNKRVSAWRTIDTGIRLMGSWQFAFEFFRKSPSVSDETLMLILASMHEQAIHLMQHYTGNNWIMMEMTGAYTFAVFFPEFASSKKIRKEAAEILSNDLARQVLPDGMQYELTPGYHTLVFSCAFTMLDLAKLEGFSGELPKELVLNLEKMADALLKMATPALTMPLCNDTGKHYIKNTITKALKLFPHRQDFLWAATGGKSGTPPVGESASKVMPYAGFVAMRSSWAKDALYLCFDIGPLGVGGHAHQDKLNINIYKGSQELLFDDGGGQYEDSPFRTYARSSRDHNTILVDGNGQHRPKEYKGNTEIIESFFAYNDKFEYAKGFFEGIYGREVKNKRTGKTVIKAYTPASHTREILFAKPDFFVIADTMKSLDNKPHTYTMLLQLDTVNVQTSPGIIHAKFKARYDLYAVVLGKESISVESGQESPVSGWRVGHRFTNNLRPASTVKITSEKTLDHRFVTLIFPWRKGIRKPYIKDLGNNKYQVSFNQKKWELDLNELRSNIK